MPNKPTTIAAPASEPDDDARVSKPSNARRRARSPKDTGNRIRVRGKRLDQIDQTKLTLAYWLLAKQIVADKTDRRSLTEPEVRAVMKRLDSVPPQEAAKSTDDVDPGAEPDDDDTSAADEPDAEAA